MTEILDRQGPLPLGLSPRRSKRLPPQPRKFRPDIEGIRAFAVLSVVIYHANLGIRGGFVGVDVFFVISGFLITRQLVDSLGKRGIRALPTFYTRRIRRLLPAGATVVIATIVVARFWAPALQIRSIATDGIYTTFYGLNYRLAVEGTEYQHQTDAVSPLQHFWSLGVEEQFYVFWPILILLATVIGRRHRIALLSVLLSAIVVVSFYYSVTVTSTNAPWAYFSVHTRAWELGLGALVAISAQRLARLPRKLAGFLAWGALGAMVASAFLYSDSTAYPGSAAALPVVATAVLIACGCGTALGVERRILGESLLQCIGRISYSWYLWHFPMLILAPMVVGHPLDTMQRVEVVWLSMVAAIITYFAIEDSGRKIGKANWQWFAGGTAISGAVVAAGALVIMNLPSLVGSGAAVTVVQADAATPTVITAMQNAISTGVDTKAAPSNLTPTPASASKDLPPSSSDGCHADYLVIKQGACVFGDPLGTHTAVLFGDSHMEQWLPAISAAGVKLHWKVVNWTKAACPAAALTVFAPTLNRTYTECDTWRQETIARIGALKPDLVFMSQSENVVSSSVSPSQWTQATVKSIASLKAATPAKIIYIEDIPIPNYDVPTCVADHLSNVSACTFALNKAYTYPSRHSATGPAVAATGVQTVDPTHWICTTTRCPAVVGNLLVYRNSTHMTKTYSTWLMPMVEPLLTTAK